MKILDSTPSNNLKWNDEFTHKLIKAKKLSYALRHLSYSSARDIKLRFDAVFIPTLFHSCTAWCNVTEGQKQQLQVLCERVGRLANSQFNVANVIRNNILELFKKSDDPAHPLYSKTANCRITSNTRPLRRPRLVSVKAKSTRYYQSFVPSTVRIYNASVS